MAVVIIRNLSQVMAGMDKLEQNMESAAEYAIAMAGLAVERQAKINANTGTHKRGEGHIPGTGPGPNVVTGNLRRSIRTDVRYGFGNYIAIVGAYAEYARAVELGSSRWKSGVKYPYLGPAADTLRKNGVLNRTFTQAFARKMRG
jgi:phage gpG-like protein